MPEFVQLPLAAPPESPEAAAPAAIASGPSEWATTPDPAPPAPAPDLDSHGAPPPRRRRRGFDPDDMARRGRIGALVLHATHDPRETTQKARESFLSRFEREVDPDGLLPADERQRRAEYARRAYFARLARQSARARSKDLPGHRHHRGTGRRAA